MPMCCPPTKLPRIAFQFPTAEQAARMKQLRAKSRVQSDQELIELALQQFEDRVFVDPYSEGRAE